MVCTVCTACTETRVSSYWCSTWEIIQIHWQKVQVFLIISAVKSRTMECSFAAPWGVFTSLHLIWSLQFFFCFSNPYLSHTVIILPLFSYRNSPFFITSTEVARRSGWTNCIDSDLTEKEISVVYTRGNPQPIAIAPLLEIDSRIGFYELSFLFLEALRYVANQYFFPFVVEPETILATRCIVRPISLQMLSWTPFGSTSLCPPIVLVRSNGDYY